MDAAKISELEIRLGHNFSDKKELYRALTHPTFSKEERERKKGKRDCPHQEIYATLGDAVLKAGFVLLLMDRGLNTKGNITIVKEDWEKNLKLADVGKRLHLLDNNLILHRMGEGEELKKGTKNCMQIPLKHSSGQSLLIQADRYLKRLSAFRRFLSPNYRIWKIICPQGRDFSPISLIWKTG
jgi:dsRNA-specific ribonuclease